MNISRIKLTKYNVDSLRIQGLKAYLTCIAKSEFQEHFYHHMLEKLGYDIFNQLNMIQVMCDKIIYKDEDNFINLTVVFFNRNTIYYIQKHSGKIRDALKEFKSDLNGVNFLTKFGQLFFKISFDILPVSNKSI